MSDEGIPGIQWQDAVAVLVRRRKLILGIFASGVATAALIGYLQGPRYRATATLMVTSHRARVAISPEANLRPSVEPVTEQDLNSQVELLKSTTLVREVLEAYRNRIEHGEQEGWSQQIKPILHYLLHLPGLVYRTIHGLPQRSPFDDYVETTAELVSVTPIAKSTLMEVSYSASTPAWTAEFVNKLIARHVQRQAQISQQSQTLHFLESQEQILAEKLQRAQETLRVFYQREGIDSIPEQREKVGAQLVQVESNLTDAEGGLAEASAKVAFLTKEVPTHPKSLVTDPRLSQTDPVQMIKTRLVQLELERGELLSKFAPTSIRVQEVDKQIADVQRVFAQEQKASKSILSGLAPTRQTLELDLAQAKAEAAGVTARIEALRARARAWRAQLGHLDQIASEQDRLEQAVTAAKQSLSTYLMKEEEARFSHALDESNLVNVAIAEPAEVPVTPELSTRRLAVLLGAIMSLLAGIGIAVVRDRIDPTIKGMAEAQSATGLPILANIPS